jgi:hypothetical protein
MTARAADFASFAAALLDPARPLPAALAAPGGGAALERRFAVHRNTLGHGLVNALAERLPVLRELLGADCFEATALAYVRADPPRSPLLERYGHGLPAWLAHFEPLRHLPWLADVARLELCRGEALDAADAPALPAAELARQLAEPDALAGTVLRLHPSLRLLRLRHAAVSVWQAHQQEPEERDARLAALDLATPENAIVLRDPDDAVLVLPLAADTAALAAALAAGGTLGEASAGHDPDTLTALLVPLLRHGAVVGLAAPPATRPGSTPA